MATEKNKELQEFLDNNEEFKGEFLGYKKSRGGLGVSRIDDDWFECEEYFISFTDLLATLKRLNTEIDF